MKMTVTENIRHEAGSYIYSLNFSDNLYIMEFADNSLQVVTTCQDKMSIRIENFFNKKSSILKTTDMGFKYIKKGGLRL